MEYKKLPVGIAGRECYQCDTNGVIYGKNGNPLRPNINSRGYKYIVFCSSGNKMKTMTVHRIIASTFIENPNNFPVVNHLDGNKLNNSVENLEWTTLSGNSRHAIDVLGKRVGVNNSKAVKVIAKNKDDNIVYRFGSISDAAKYFTKPNCSYRRTETIIWRALSPKYPNRHTAYGYKWEYDKS